MRAFVAARLQRLLFSSRPRWALMPSAVAGNFVDNLLFTLSALEQHGIAYTAHFGTLLGSVRLGGVCPWDEDADIFVIDQTRDSIEQKLGPVLRAHGFLLIYDPRDFFWIRQNPWWAGQGHIGLGFLPRVSPAGSGIPSSADDPSLSWEELYPQRRLPFHGSWLWGPADNELVLRRLYLDTGSKATMSRFSAPTLDPEVQTFWQSARPQQTPLDWPAVSARFLKRYRDHRFAHVATFPWWWANGAYNIGIKQLRLLGQHLQ